MRSQISGGHHDARTAFSGVAIAFAPLVAVWPVRAQQSSPLIVIEDRGHGTRAYVTAMDVGPRWREHIANSLKRMQDTMNTLNSI